MDIFPIKFTYSARTPVLLKLIFSMIGIAANVVTWFVFAASLAAGVAFGWGLF